ncbi:Uu.00g113240.m01.CDS01 [Anthostomella pinea]|uniref:tRNA (uracil-O(2)-)-methyltransferase n=1 Tax=Anthostomella pinea TaxID=933095 RepID=A0AAI8YGF6_9PEZI|nr:Uu.00g113240.m01.CDS01 [Anthostomella pinea]
MASEPYQYPDDLPSLIEDVSGARWAPLHRQSCAFGRDAFFKVMMNLIRNPNINSSWLFRADILVEQDFSPAMRTESPNQPILVHFSQFDIQKVLVRKLIPRNTRRDEPLDQTCLLYHGTGTGEVQRSMVVYKPHVSSHAEMPFYHPKVQGIAFLHEWNFEDDKGTISIHYHFFNDHAPSPKLVRTGLYLLSTLHKHGEGSIAGYVKRVHHDTVVPQITVQNTYARLKEKYARGLIEGWAEVTDPTKHVFEDLGIAAFLIELWAQMFRGSPFPGFVDIGCGNGLLVYLLRQEGYAGWGFDARKRKSWDNYSHETAAAGNQNNLSLRQHVLLPSVLNTDKNTVQVLDDVDGADLMHDGLFPKGTFIISNHADELTPWTPIIATLSDCPFIMIPCCSHDLSGARFRAPAPKQQGKSPSAYSSLVEWVKGIGKECGWAVETEMLRIPSTRNTALIGRHRVNEASSIDIQAILSQYGGTDGYADNVIKLAKSAPRGH